MPGISHQFSIVSAWVKGLSQTVSAVSAGYVSSDARVDALSAAISVLSQQISVLSQQVSVLSSQPPGSGSVTSTELSAVSAQAASAINVVSQAVSVLSQQVSTLSQAVSVVSQAVSVLSQAVSALSSQVSTVSGNVTSVEVHASTASAAATSADAHAAAASAAATSVDARLNSVVSTFLSATGQVVPQIRSRGNVVSVISAGTLVDIASLSVSVAGGDAIYKIDGAVAFEKATSGGCAFGISTPALGAGGSYVEMAVAVLVQQAGAIGAAATYAWGRVALSAIAAANTAVVSASVLNINALRFMHFEGMLAVSTAGTVQIMGKGSVAGDSLSVRGGYIRAYRIG